MARSRIPAPSKLSRHWLRAEERSSSLATAREVRPLLLSKTSNRTSRCFLCGCRVRAAPVGSSGALGKLEKMGFPKDAFFGAITSGEVCHQALQNRPDDFYRSLGKRCVHITWGARGAISLGDLDVEVIFWKLSLLAYLLLQMTRKRILRDLERHL